MTLFVLRLERAVRRIWGNLIMMDVWNFDQGGN